MVKSAFIVIIFTTLMAGVAANTPIPRAWVAASVFAQPMQSCGDSKPPATSPRAIGRLASSRLTSCDRCC
jgi:hypothetical protein